MLQAGKTRLRWRGKTSWSPPKPLTTATFIKGSEYVPGLDAGKWSVRDDNGQWHNHWTIDEMLDYWEVIE